jgi:hypothetical protein
VQNGRLWLRILRNERLCKRRKAGTNEVIDKTTPDLPNRIGYVSNEHVSTAGKISNRGLFQATSRFDRVFHICRQSIHIAGCVLPLWVG